MFKQGDKAVCTLDGQEVEIQFGPFSSVGFRRESYLVEWPSGTSSIVSTEDLELAPRFEVGQEVVFHYDTENTLYELVSGPFRDAEGDTFWVTKDEAGNHDPSWDKYMVAVK